MKSILVPVESYIGMETVLKTAALITHHLKGTLTGIPLRAIQFQVAGAEPIVAVSFPQQQQNDQDSINKSKTYFTDHAASNPQDKERMSWNGKTAIDDNGLSCLARAYDLTAIGRPSVDHAGPRMTTLEAVLFDSGRPIFITPPVAPAQLGKNVVISWNCSTEAARTLAFAMPLLHLADKVSVLTIEEAVVTGPSGAEICAYLAANAIAASNYVISTKGRKPGAAILEEACELGCDLLVKSAYTQSRLRQMIFGGATSHILSHTELPVFMAN